MELSIQILSNVNLLKNECNINNELTLNQV